MNHQLRRSSAIAAIAALSVGAGATVAVSAASAASTSVVSTAPGDTRLLGLTTWPVLGPVLTPILDEVTTVLPAPMVQTLEQLPPVDLATVLGHADAPQLTTLLDTLSPSSLVDALDVLDLPLVGEVLDTALSQADGANLVANLLAGADGGQLTSLLGALDPVALEEIVNTLLPAPLAGVLGGASGGDLTTLVGALDPAKITELLTVSPDAATVTSLISGLTGVLAGGGSADALAGPLAQLQALLAGLPLGTDLLQLDGLFGTVTGLLGTAGLADLPIAGPLLETLTRTSTAGGATPTAAASTLTSGLASLLGARPVPAPPAPAPAPKPATPAPKPATPAAVPAPSAPAAVRKNYRATIGKTVLAKSRKSTVFTVTCPKTAPKGCVVKVSASLANKKVLKPKWIAVLSGKSTKVRVKLTKSATKRLKSKGGTLKFRAATATSTSGAVLKSLKVKKIATKKAAKR